VSDFNILRRIPDGTGFNSSFSPRDRVIVDGDPSLIGIVTSFQFRPSTRGDWNETIEISYTHNGALMVAWVEADRLTIAESRGWKADAPR
jgi:hypothetical protein